MNKPSSTLVGVSGEYFVAAELSRRGYVASITLRNTRGIDIIASNEEGSKTVNIQVKTKRFGVPDWILTKKSETLIDNNMFYVFVALKKDNELPNFHICSSIDASKYVIDTYQSWLNTPGKKGQKRKDTNIRIWDDPNNDYLNRWDLLNLDHI